MGCDSKSEIPDPKSEMDARPPYPVAGAALRTAGGDGRAGAALARRLFLEDTMDAHGDDGRGVVQFRFCCARARGSSAANRFQFVVRLARGGFFRARPRRPAR